MHNTPIRNDKIPDMQAPEPLPKDEINTSDFAEILLRRYHSDGGHGAFTPADFPGIKVSQRTIFRANRLLAKAGFILCDTDNHWPDFIYPGSITTKGERLLKGEYDPWKEDGCCPRVGTLC